MLAGRSLRLALHIQHPAHVAPTCQIDNCSLRDIPVASILSVIQAAAKTQSLWPCGNVQHHPHVTELICTEKEQGRAQPVANCWLQCSHKLLATHPQPQQRLAIWQRQDGGLLGAAARRGKQIAAWIPLQAPDATVLLHVNIRLIASSAQPRART